MRAPFPPRWSVVAALTLTLTLTLAACTSAPPFHPPQPLMHDPAVETATLREAALRDWRVRILPRFMSHLEMRSPGLAAQLTLDVVDRPRSAEPCRGATPDLELMVATVTDLRRLAEAIVFIAREPRYTEQLPPYIRHVREARFGAHGTAAATAVQTFDAYAQAPSNQFAQILQDPPIARLRVLLERESLAVLLAQKIGEVATATGTANGSPPPARAPPRPRPTRMQPTWSSRAARRNCKGRFLPTCCSRSSTPIRMRTRANMPRYVAAPSTLRAATRKAMTRGKAHPTPTTINSRSSASSTNRCPAAILIRSYEARSSGAVA